MAALEYHRTDMDRDFLYDNFIRPRHSITKVLKLPREKLQQKVVELIVTTTISRKLTPQRQILLPSSWI
jgi:hypothetical protein